MSGSLALGPSQFETIEVRIHLALIHVGSRGSGESREAAGGHNSTAMIALLASGRPPLYCVIGHLSPLLVRSLFESSCRDLAHCSSSWKRTVEGLLDHALAQQRNQRKAPKSDRSSYFGDYYSNPLGNEKGYKNYSFSVPSLKIFVFRPNRGNCSTQCASPLSLGCSLFPSPSLVRKQKSANFSCRYEEGDELTTYCSQRYQEGDGLFSIEERRSPNLGILTRGIKSAMRSAVLNKVARSWKPIEFLTHLYSSHKFEFRYFLRFRFDVLNDFLKYQQVILGRAW